MGRARRHCPLLAAVDAEARQRIEPRDESLASRVWRFLALVSVVGVCVVVIRSLLPPDAAVPLHAGLVATLRTGVLAAAAIIVAWLGRRLGTREFGALLYPVLGWGALKLLIEDFRTSPPSLLFVAFALYGGALILGPRIAKIRCRQGRP